MAVDKMIWKIILDIVVLACVGVPLLVIHLSAEPFRRGFFANDVSLMLPYKEQTVSVGVLAGVAFALIIVTVLIVEIVRDKQGKNVGEKFLCASLIPGWVWESYAGIGIFAFGAACQLLLVNSAKYVIGRLRPHFFDLCRPNPVPGSDISQYSYIEDYTCTNPIADLALQKEMRLSFPSAHASFAMYTAVFFILYIQVKCKWRGSKLLRHGVQFAALIAAWYVGLSRVVDHVHHWEDVAVGFIVGAVFAAIVFVYVLKPKKYGIPGPGSWETSQPDMLPRPVLAR